MKYAPLWKRALAFLIDGFVVVAVTYGLILWSDALEAQQEPPGVFFMLVNVLNLGFGWLYFAFLESSPSGQTLGKKWMGIQVRHLTGLRLSFEQASLRWKLRFYLVLLSLSWVLVPPLWMNPRRQFLHDSASESLVLEKPKSEK